MRSRLYVPARRRRFARSLSVSVGALKSARKLAIRTSETKRRRGGGVIEMKVGRRSI
jgi:hypothetical protein